jgi:uncharacterized protein
VKYLLVLLVIAAAYLLWRNARLARRKDQAAAAPPTKSPQDMVRCPVCAVHLPRSDAVAGPDGTLYCSQEHRLTAGG